MDTKFYYRLDAVPARSTMTVPLGDLVTEFQLLTPEEAQRMVPRDVEAIPHALKVIFEVYPSDPFAGSCDWRSHEADMCMVSRRMPDVVFTLTVIANRGDNVRVKYFKGGKMQAEKATIVDPEFYEPRLM